MRPRDSSAEPVFGWVVWDAGASKRGAVYVELPLAMTRAEAEYELAMLLQGYAPDHEWRARLTIAWVERRGGR